MLEWLAYRGYNVETEAAEREGDALSTHAGRHIVRPCARWRRAISRGSDSHATGRRDDCARTRDWVPTRRGSTTSRWRDSWVTLQSHLRRRGSRAPSGCCGGSEVLSCSGHSQNKGTVMATENLSIGRHNFAISTVPVQGGGCTISVVHRFEDGAETVETRHDSEFVYETDEQALEQGRVLARQIAARRL